MKILPSILDFVPAFEGVYFTIEGTAEEVGEVSIFGGLFNDLINNVATKSLSGRVQYTINAAPFIYQLFAIKPLRTTVIEPLLTKRICNVFIMLQCGASKTYSAYSNVYAGVVLIDKYKPMSDRLFRSVMVGEIDEVSVLIDNNWVCAKYKVSFTNRESAIVVSEDITVLTTMISVVVDTKMWAARYPGKKIDKIELELGYNQIFKFIGVFKFEDKKSETITLKWVNRYGAIDSYSFDNLNQKSIYVNKRKIYHQDQAHIVAASTHTELQISTRCDSLQTTEWLSWILKSPQVWIDNGVEFEPVDVITDKIVSKRDELSVIELTIKKISQDKIQIM